MTQNDHNINTSHSFTAAAASAVMNDIINHIRNEIAAWNYDNAAVLGAEIERDLNSGIPIDRLVAAGISTLLARVHANMAESKPSDAAEHVARIKHLLARAEEMLPADSEQEAELFAFKASLECLEKGSDAALAMLEDKCDPYAIRTKTALFVNQKKWVDALRVIEGLEIHERWCDVAVIVYVRNDQLEKAQSVVRWAAGLSDRTRLPQCVVKLAGALLEKTVTEHEHGQNFLPCHIADAERAKLTVVIETLKPVLENIRLAGKPSSELDMVALRIAWQANHLLQRREQAAEILRFMNRWTPVPVDVAKGIVLGYIVAPPDLPERLRHDHPGDLEANLLACGIQSVSLNQHHESFAEAKKLLPLADDDKKKEELFRLFLQLWQNMEGPDVAECEMLAGQLVEHTQKLKAILTASIALRGQDADTAIAALDQEKSPEDPHWLQLRANAYLAKQQPGEAADLLLVAAEKTHDPGLLLKAGVIAFQANSPDLAIRCFEELLAIQPYNIVARSNLAHIYTFVQPDFEKAAEQFRALHALDPGNQSYALNLAICLARTFRPEESLALYDELCKQEIPPLQAVIGRAQLHHGLGNPGAALDSLKPFRERFWAEPAFLMEYMSVAYAAGDEESANEALKELTRLKESGNTKVDSIKKVHINDVKEMFSHKQKQTEHFHEEMIKGRMPWSWSAQMSNRSILYEWLIRTQKMPWIIDTPTNRASYCIYSTNGFHPRESEKGKRELLPLECPPVGTKIVADISALITLQRLSLLDVAAEYFGEILVPADYLATVLEDSKNMVQHQRSRRESAEAITKLANDKRIFVLAEKSDTRLPLIDEYGNGTDHRYRLVDLISPLRAVGLLSDAQYERIAKICAKPSGVDEAHPALHEQQEILVDLVTLEALPDFGLLNTVTQFFQVHLRAKDYRELGQRLEALDLQDKERSWHLDMWRRLRDDARFHFVPHPVPEELRQKNEDTKDYLPFLANFIAKETKAPLLADDRVCQAFTLNEVQDSEYAAFGSDTLILALTDGGRLAPDKAAEAFRQLMVWRYRFIVPSAEMLKALADQYRGSPPGKALREVAEYVHDCMRDPGLFCGPETTQGDSMAMRLYLAWITSVAEFLVLVWADDSFPDEAATKLTKWAVHAMIPSLPVNISGPSKMKIGGLTNRLFLSHALIESGSQFGKERIARGMEKIKDALGLDNDEYTRIVTEILNDYARTTAQL